MKHQALFSLKDKSKKKVRKKERKKKKKCRLLQFCMALQGLTEHIPGYCFLYVSYLGCEAHRRRKVKNIGGGGKF